jgi:hypothetical protein
MEKITIPISKESQRYRQLDAMAVSQVLVIEAKDQQKYSETAGVFHKATEKIFRTSKKGQENGKAIVWRVK